MRPLQLDMEGFGAFRESTEIDFRDIDLLALVGATGSGKSTIIDAITFALYGSVARYDDNKVVAFAINQTSTRARVRLDFELGGRTYTAARLVQRTDKGATTKEARLERDGEVLADDARGMTRAVEELLGLDADQFNRTVVLPQGRFADFLHDSPRKRQDTLRHLLGLDMYERIGQAARKRGAAARNKIEALQPALHAGEAELTDERRADLAAMVSAIGEVRERFAVDCDGIAALQRESDQLTARLGVLDENIRLLTGIRVPGELADLDRRLRDATARRDAAVAAVAEARLRRQETVAAVAAGPDLLVSTAQLAQRRAAAELDEQHRAVADELARATEASAVARLVAETVAARQRDLDATVDQARGEEQLARAAAEAGPNPAQLAAWVHLHARRVAGAAALAATEADEAAVRTALEPLVSAAAAALALEDAARQHLGDVQQRVGAAAYARLLVVGEPCPLCQQEVHDLPSHDFDDELRRAEDAHEAARADRKSADQQRDDARERHRAAAAAVNAQGNALAGVDAELAGVAALDALRRQEHEAERLRVTVERAVEAVWQAVTEAAAHRNDPANVAAVEQAALAHDRATGLSARADDLADRLARAQAALIDVPSETVLTDAIGEAEQFAADQRAADEACTTAEAERDAAIGRLDAIQDDVRAAGQQLTAARDRVVALGPPLLAGANLLADWDVLSAWAGDRTDALDAERAQVDINRTDAFSRLQLLDREARQRCATALAVDTSRVELAILGQHLAAAETESSGALERFDERRAELAELRARVDGLRAQAEVADTLQHLLRAAGFESWLMASALEGLVDAASVRLRELSGGQFSLELDDRNFAVRDHANADEIRSARTLSGGETFLASLSLALALADATAELAPEGAPTIESIFLDEGFGTLDPQALDTVATAIEELGAEGRMVGIVTHIRELADRMPVRLEVTKTASTSTVERVEA